MKFRRACAGLFIGSAVLYGACSSSSSSSAVADAGAPDASVVDASDTTQDSAPAADGSVADAGADTFVPDAGPGPSCYTADSHTTALWLFNENTGFSSNDQINGQYIVFGGRTNVLPYPTWVPGHKGSALNFQTRDGGFAGETADNDTPDETHPLFTTAFTAELWMKNSPPIITTGPGPSPTVFSADLLSLTLNYTDTNQPQWGFFLGNVSDPDAAGFVREAVFAPTTAMQDTNWHYVALTYDGTTMNFYIDGAVVGSKTLAFKIQPSYAESFGSAYDGFSGTYYNGTIDDVRISNIARSSAEIAAIAACN